MIDRENLTYIQNILSLHNSYVNSELIYDILTAVKENDNVRLVDLILSNLNDESEEIQNIKEYLVSLFYEIKENNYVKIADLVLSNTVNYSSNTHRIKEILTSLFYAIKEHDELLFYTILLPTIDKNLKTDYLKNVLLTIKHEPHLKEDIFDSFSDNQFASKGELLSAIKELNILNKDSNLAIWGCWYGSILIPSLINDAKHIVALDLNNEVLQIAKNRFFPNHKNIDYVCDDVFKSWRKIYTNLNLVINTSCEHMPPMKEWKWFGPGAIAEDTDKGKKGGGFASPKLSSNCYFAFQSNNMFGIEGHVNCVNSLDEFKAQLPERAEVLIEKEITDTRGTRYMLVGKFNPL